MPNLSTLRGELRRHDPLAVIAGCAALQLVPQNTPHLARIDGLTRHVLSLQQHQTRQPDHIRWRRWLSDSPSLHTGPSWDPPEGLFCEPLHFYGGSRTLPSAGEPGLVFQLQLVLDALTFGDWPEDAREYRQRMFTVAGALLAWVDRAARAAGLSRSQPVASSPRLVVPAPADLQRTVAALTTDLAGLTELCGGNPKLLDELTLDLAAGAVPHSADPADQPFELRPVLKSGDHFVLPEPAAIAVALRHFVIAQAIAVGLREHLAQQIAARTRAWLIEALSRLDWRHNNTLAAGPWLDSLILSFDTDKAAHVVLMHDSLDHYEPESSRGGWWTGDDEAVRDQMAEIEEAMMFGPPPRPNEVFHLAVIGGVGRLSTVGLQAVPGGLSGPQKLLTAEALDWITLLRPDQLTLYRAALAGERLREHTRVLAMNALDEFAMWLDHDESFNLSDDARPNFLGIEGDWGRSLREKVAVKRDVHAALTPELTTVPVVRMYEAAEVPIFGDYIETGVKPRLLVENPGGPIWVRAPDGLAPSERGPHISITDCLAYWLWQLQDALAELTWPGPVLVVDVSVEDAENWTADLRGPDDVSGPVARVATTPEGVSVVIFPDFVALSNQPNNRAERELVQLTLTALSSMSERSGGCALSADQHQQILESVAPLGLKRKLSLFDGRRASDADATGLPSYRPMQKAPTEELLDGLGARVAEASGLGVGPVEPDQRNELLKTTVAVLFRHLEATVAQLSPNGLLEQLVTLHEAGLAHDAEIRLTLGARLACFDATALIDDLREQIPLASQTAAALRFLIEYIIARPPRGLRPFSLGIYDDLLALAGQIITRGMQSDAIRYELDADAQISILGSGRLGYDQTSTFYSGQQSYLDAAIPALMHGLAASYERAWEAPAQPPTQLDELEAACVAEFGFSLTELAELFSYSAQAGASREPGAAVENFGVLADEIAGQTGWLAERASQGLKLLTLEPRARFDRPPQPFSAGDIYPWRFNRALSYLRRPLLVRGDSVVWGPRHAGAAGKYLIGLIFDDRLKASSPQMRAVMSRMRSEETQAFNDRVADLHRTLGRRVRCNLKKAAGLRIERNPAETLGDLDVVSADETTRVLYLEECKDLQGARTPAELHNEIANTFASGVTPKSALDKHQERIAWVAAHLSEVLGELDISDTNGWVIRGRIVVDVEVPSPYVVRCPLDVLTAHRVAGGD